MSTTYINLLPQRGSGNDDENLELLFKQLRKKKRIIVVAGAGVSESGGVPPFRPPPGVGSTNDCRNNAMSIDRNLFDISVFSTNEKTEKFNLMTGKLSRMIAQAKPTLFHYFIATLARRKQLRRLYTQNIDGIDLRVEPLTTTVPLRRCHGRGWPNTIQLHGSLGKTVCCKCLEIGDFEPADFQGQQELPLCVKCSALSMRRSQAQLRSTSIGRLRPRITLCPESAWDSDAIGEVSAADIQGCPDAVIVVGTAFRISGVYKLVKELSKATHHSGGICIWLNVDCPPTAQNRKIDWDFIVLSKCDYFADRYGIRKGDLISVQE